LKFNGNSCQQVQSYLDSYVNNELLVETNHEMQKHLNTCRDCAAELETRARMRNLLQRAVRAETAPAALSVKIRQQIQANQSVSFLSIMSNPLAIAASLTLALMLAAWGAISVWNIRQPLTQNLATTANPNLSEQSMRILGIGLSDHVHCAIESGYAIENLDYDTNNVDAEYLGLVPLVKERVGSDFGIVAAHHCISGERDFIHFILRNTTATLSVVITKRRGENFPSDDRATLRETSGAPLYGMRMQDYAVVGFESGDYFAFVISNLSTADNERIASNVAPAVRSFLAHSQGAARI
jgi:anti-sigma factor (TIGR02949 family)